MIGPEVTAAKEVSLGADLTVLRALPQHPRRTVGAWCFADLFGPADVSKAWMEVDPHPHIGLQTVSWLLDGRILHRDSLGNEQVSGPGDLNLMTAGRGIAHSERTPPGTTGSLHGAQLWLALPDGRRDVEPAFAHHDQLPVVEVDGFTATVFVGEWQGARSPAEVFSPLVGAEVRGVAGARSELPIRSDFEHAIVVLSGSLVVGGTAIEPGVLAYVPPGEDALEVHSPEASTALLLGGAPFTDELHMYWNFVGGSRQELDEARVDWEAGRRFPDVPGDPGPRTPAPPAPWSRV